MSRPDKIVIDGRAYRWRDIVELRRQQLEAWKAARPEQPALFALKLDSRHAAERSAVGRYREPSLLDALREGQLGDLRAGPSSVTVDDRQARTQVGQDIPVRVIDLSTVNSGGAAASAVPKATVSFKSVGIILNVTPHITSNGQVLLDVHAENSNAQIASSDIGYVFNKQSADNRLLVGFGETAVIGGLTVTQITQD